MYLLLSFQRLAVWTPRLPAYNCRNYTSRINVEECVWCSIFYLLTALKNLYWCFLYLSAFGLGFKSEFRKVYFWSRDRQWSSRAWSSGCKGGGTFGTFLSISAWFVADTADGKERGVTQLPPCHMHKSQTQLFNIPPDKMQSSYSACRREMWKRQ